MFIAQAFVHFWSSKPGLLAMGVGERCHSELVKATDCPELREVPAARMCESPRSTAASQCILGICALTREERKG